MSPSVLLTGAAGLLGGWLLRVAPEDREVIALTRRRAVPGPQVRADLRDSAATMKALSCVRPELVVHAAYATDQASIVDATGNLVAAADAVGADVVLISTDAVFSGDGVERDEGALPDPVWDYGEWKVDAERIVGQSNRGTIIRLPLLVSIRPDDHVVSAIRSAARRRKTTQWFTDEVRMPAMAHDIAAAVWRIAALPPAKRAAVWHLAGVERLTRYEIATRIVDRLGLDPTVIEGVPTPAGVRRPRDLTFTDARARTYIGWSPAPILRGHPVRSRGERL